MHFKTMSPALPAGYQKTYLSREMSRVYAMDNPVGDPFGGPAYGEKNGPAVAIALPVLGMAGSYAAFAAATTTLGAVMAGAAFAGSALSLAGTVSGNTKLSKIGSVLSIAGGLGMGADALLQGGNFTFSGGQASGAPEWLQSTQSSLGMTPATTPVAPADAVKAEVATGSTADLTGPSASYAGGNINAGPGSAASGINTPGGMTSPLNAAPGSQVDMFGTASGAPFDSFGNPLGNTAVSDISLNSIPGSTATGAGAGAGAGEAAKGFGGQFLSFAKDNPLVTMMGFQAVGGLSDWLSGKTDAEIDALDAQTRAMQAQGGLADARTLQIQEQIALEKQRRANLNAGYSQVNAGISVNPVSIPMPWAQNQQPPAGLIAGNMPPRG